MARQRTFRAMHNASDSTSLRPSTRTSRSSGLVLGSVRSMLHTQCNRCRASLRPQVWEASVSTQRAQRGMFEFPGSDCGTPAANREWWAQYESFCVKCAIQRYQTRRPSPQGFSCLLPQMEPSLRQSLQCSSQGKLIIRTKAPLRPSRAPRRQLPCTALQECNRYLCIRMVSRAYLLVPRM